MNLQNGVYVVKTRSIVKGVYHYGVVVVSDDEANVYHSTFRNPVSKNGDNIIVESFEDFSKNYKPISLTITNVTESQLYERLKKVAGKKYNRISFNSNHFVQKIAPGFVELPQEYRYYIGFLLLVIVFLLIIRK